jgi:hypothetical protein
MKTFILTVVLIFALAGSSFGWGSRGGSSNNQGSYNSNGQYVTNNNPTNGGGAGPAGGAVAVPEPATLILLGAGLAGIYGIRRFKK